MILVDHPRKMSKLHRSSIFWGAKANIVSMSLNE